MRWEDGQESQNVEDRRGERGGGGGFGLPIGRGGVGIGTLLVALIVGWIFGINPLTILGVFGGGDSVVEQQQREPQQRPGPQGPSPRNQGLGGSQPAHGDDQARFASVILKSTEEVWSDILKQKGYRGYSPPRLVLYSGQTRTACGLGSAASGPFYCPGDSRLYLDTSFFRVMSERLGAKGEAAQAYVIAHEVGHHVQNLTGTMNKMEQARHQVSERQYNQLSVRLELQADCYAGVWASRSQDAHQWFDKGDIEDALRAAGAVGDDRLQKASGAAVVPDSFTHGSSEQRMQWLRRGMQNGNMDDCNTFAQ